MKVSSVMDVLDAIEHCQDGKTITLKPGPLSVKVGHNDAVAAALLKQFANEGMTVGDTLRVLQAATWWVQLWASLPEEDTHATD